MVDSQTARVTDGVNLGCRSSDVLANGLRLHYLEAGSGPPLVLLHGTAIDSAALSFGPSLPELASRHRVLALDWPGYGGSERPKIDMTMPQLVALLEGFLDAVGLERVNLAGFSMGGAVALGFALQSPGRLSTLTLVASYGLDDRLLIPVLPYLAMRVPNLSRSVVWGMRRSRLLVRLVLQNIVFSDPSLVSKDLVQKVHAQLKAPGAERSFVAWLRGEMRPFKLGTPYGERLTEVAVPTLLLHGVDDLVVPSRKARRASGQIDGSRLILVPGCGHWVSREATAVLVKELSGFIAEHDHEAGDTTSLASAQGRPASR